jgi:alkanesulfonate monooxygenase SsuD/methylene tetrahydromethanopterin reductase-like flavin-dependent oxidoreductase (luciferase family)
VPTPGRSITRLGLQLPNPLPRRSARGIGDQSGGGGLFDRVIAVAQEAERAGFDSVWLTDDQTSALSIEHSAPGSRGRDHRTLSSEDREGPDESMFEYEAYSLLGALSVKTHTVRLGVLPGRPDPRSPSILCKIVTGVDVISHGRAVVTMQLNPDIEEDSVELFDEGLAVCQAMLREDRPEFSGQYFTIEGAINRPRPIQDGGVPIVAVLDEGQDMSPGRASDVLGVAARFCDAVVVSGLAESVREAKSILEEPKESTEKRTANNSEVGRSDTASRGGFDPEVIWRDSGGGKPDDSQSRGVGLTGSSAQVAGRVRDRLLAGASGCILRLEVLDPSEPLLAYTSAIQKAIGSV